MKIIRKSTLKRYIDSCVKREVAKRLNDSALETRKFAKIARQIGDLVFAFPDTTKSKNLFAAFDKVSKAGDQIRIDQRNEKVEPEKYVRLMEDAISLLKKEKQDSDVKHAISEIQKAIRDTKAL